MPFEAFLSDTHARPPRAAKFGFLASMALHGPPITVFVTTWLTHAMLIGSSGIYAEVPPTHGTYFIPISIYGQGPGNGGAVSTATQPGAGAAGSRPRAGLLGRSGRAGRRGLVAPREIKRLTKKSAWVDPFMVGSYATPDAHGAIGHDSGGGDDRAGHGNGSGAGGLGIGGSAGEGGSGNGLLAAQRAKLKEKQRELRGNHQPGQDRGGEHGSDPDDDVDVGSDLEVVSNDGHAVRAAYISQDSAAYFRTRDDMPGLPAWLAGHREYAMLFRICVSTEGTVSNVVVLKSANEEADQVLCNAIQKWQYRPRIVDGSPRPFCHPIRIVYSRP
jgi:hypothetical protein